MSHKSPKVHSNIPKVLQKNYKTCLPKPGNAPLQAVHIVPRLLLRALGPFVTGSIKGPRRGATHSPRKMSLVYLSNKMGLLLLVVGCWLLVVACCLLLLLLLLLLFLFLFLFLLFLLFAGCCLLFVVCCVKKYSSLQPCQLDVANIS